MDLQKNILLCCLSKKTQPIWSYGEWFREAYKTESRFLHNFPKLATMYTKYSSVKYWDEKLFRFLSLFLKASLRRAYLHEKRGGGTYTQHSLHMGHAVLHYLGHHHVCWMGTVGLPGQLLLLCHIITQGLNRGGSHSKTILKWLTVALLN